MYMHIGKHFFTVIRSLLLLMLPLLSFQFVATQPTKNGYAVYQFLNGNNYETIDFWFSADA